MKTETPRPKIATPDHEEKALNLVELSKAVHAYLSEHGGKRHGSEPNEREVITATAAILQQQGLRVQTEAIRQNTATGQVIRPDLVVTNGQGVETVIEVKRGVLNHYPEAVRANRYKPAAQQNLTDAIWFKSRIDEAGLTYRKLGPMIGLDHAALSNIVNGKRKLSLDEARALAVALGSTLEEVARRAGIDMPRGALAQTVPVVGMAGSDGSVSKGSYGTTAAPGGPATGLKAVRGAGGLVDGWTMLYRDGMGVSAEAVDRLCVAELRGGAVRVGWLRRGWEPGEWLLEWNGQRETVGVVSANPLVWIRQS